MMMNDISTHTLTWSVTTLVGSFPEPNINFNSHAHVERDWLSRIPVINVKNFNSHAHVERDI